MDANSESTDRTVADYVLFAFAFFGFLLGISGVIVSAPVAAVIGLMILLLSILSFGVAG